MIIFTNIGRTYDAGDAYGETSQTHIFLSHILYQERTFA